MKVLVSAVLIAVLPAVSWSVAQSVYKETAVQNGGTIRGTVRFKGNPPPPQQLDITKDPMHCGSKKVSPCLAVAKNRGVKDALVYLEGITQGRKPAVDAKLTLDQEKCEYRPHMQIVPVGSKLEIINSDPLLHSVHAYAMLDVSGNPVSPPVTLFNIALPVKGQRIPKLLDKPGLLLLMCDAGHPWMEAFVMVAEHPYYTVTDEDGNFTLENVPPGSYTIKMWHEGLATIEKSANTFLSTKPYESSKKVQVSSGGAVTVDFDLVLR